MKPNFALTMSYDGIGLLHRAGFGWDVVGEVPLDALDLSGQLAKLRQRAQYIEPDGICTKLVLPNQQLRFLQFEAEGRDVDAIARAVQQQLEGATPYALDELAYDWSISAGQVFIAAVARETLVEAETFATKHGFEPLCFVATPESHDFFGEPWFGPTDYAETLLRSGFELERDTTAIRITGVATAPEQRDVSPEPLRNAPVSQSPEAKSEPDVAEENEEPSAPVGAGLNNNATSASTSAPLAFSTKRTEPKVAPEAAVHSASAEGAEQTGPTTPPVKAFVTSDTLLPEVDMPDHDIPQADVTKKEPRPSDETAEPIAQDPSDQDKVEPDVFATKRSAAPLAAKEGLTSQAADFAPVPSKDDTQGMTLFGAGDPKPAVGTHRYPGASLAATLVIVVFGVATWAAFFGSAGTDGEQADASQSLLLPKDSGVAEIDTVRNDKDVVSLPRTIEEQTPETAPTTENALNIEAPEDTKTIAESDAGVPDAETEQTAEIEDGATFPDSQPDQTEALTTDEVEKSVFDSAGVWQRAPDTLPIPGTQSLSDVYQTSIDPEVTTQDAVALPGASDFSTDSQPGAIPDPAPPGSHFDLDERGLVRATPDGALTPDGIFAFSGRPTILPPERPAETRQEESDGGQPENILNLTETQLAQMATVRPQLRPDDLSELNERGALGSGGRTQAELAGLRPKLRPQSAQELAEQSASASTAGLSVEEEEEDAFAGATDQAVSTSLVPRERPDNFSIVVALAEQAAEERASEAAQREAARQAQQQAQQQAQSTTQQQAATSQSASLAQPLLEPEDTQRVAAAAVPRNQRIRPSDPTAASVARAATEENMLRLRRINLIGVYGGPSDRRALVRLANGRYKKVAVGDRLDGGRVTAIGVSDLRYSKGGRNLELKMPKG